MHLSDGHIYLPTENGQWVSQTQRRVAEILHDYDPNLQLQWIPPDQRSVRDLAFRVVDVSPGRPPYVVCVASEADERLLARVFGADQTKGNTLNYLDKHNAAVEALRMKEAMEKNEEATRIAYAILHSKKFHYRHNGVDFERARGSHSRTTHIR